MRELSRQDVVGRRIADIIISVPDEPISMSGMSYSAGYLRLDNGVTFGLGVRPPLIVDDCVTAAVHRSAMHESEFRSLLHQEVEDVVSGVEDGSLYVLTKHMAIVMVPSQFWVRPCLYERTEIIDETEPFWKA
jgi:hypothetical protein